MLNYLFIVLIGVAIFSCESSNKKDTIIKVSKPNIVFFFIDDMGWKDLTSYGAKLYETPNIDALANEGIQFMNAYTSAPICSPARASVLTGKHPVKLGMWNHFHLLPKGEKILPQYLKEYGYQTWHIGKWHMGNFEDATMPQDLGFDVNIGGHISWAPGSYFWPYGVDSTGNCIKERRCVPGLVEGGKEGEYLTDRLTREAIKLIENKDEEKPFYLNLWHYAVHSGQEGKPELVQKYKDKIKALGIDTTYRYDEKTGANLLTSETNAVFAAMIQSVDESLAKVGSFFKLNKAYDQLAWQGPHENYSDLYIAAHYGRYEMAIEDLYFPYGKPQENGNRKDVHRVVLSGKGMPTMEVTAAQGINFSAHQYTLENLIEAKHLPDIQEGDFVTLNLDHAQMGLGGDTSWRPQVHEEFLLDEDTYRFSYIIRFSE